MPVIDNKKYFSAIELQYDKLSSYLADELVTAPFCNDFIYRFCWSTNSLEGNTLTLDDTISVLDYDEVRGGHKYEEYHDAKQQHKAILQMLIPLQKRKITEEWIKDSNGIIQDTKGEYRDSDIYIGTVVEAVYYPPKHSAVPEHMASFLKTVNFISEGYEKDIKTIAMQHMAFEQMHPFKDGNGRVGRMILNLQLINCHMLPIAIEKKSDYRQAFRKFQQNHDTSLMEHIICKGQLESLDRIQKLADSMAQRDR